MSLSILRTCTGAVLALLAIQTLGMTGLPLLDVVEEAEAQIITMPVNTVATTFGQPGQPVFEHYTAPSSLPGHNSYGNRHLGISWKTDNVMVKSGVHTYRVVFDDSFVPAQARWTDASYPLEVTGNLDNLVPIVDAALETNHRTGRTWTGSLASYYEGNTHCGSFAYSDDDGQHWNPMTVPCPQGTGMIQPTIASGPWWDGFWEEFVLTGEDLHPGYESKIYPEAVYYCATMRSNPHQTTVGLSPLNEMVSCSVSHDGGETFIPATGGAVANGNPLFYPACLMAADAVTGTVRPPTIGHGKVGWNGVLYLPHASCSDGATDPNGALLYNATLLVSTHNDADFVWRNGQATHDWMEDLWWNGTIGLPVPYLNTQFDGRTADACDLTSGQLPNRAPGDQRLGRCGAGTFDPSVGISERNETDGSYTIYFAQAEADGLYVGMSRDGGLTWEPQGEKNGNPAMNVNWTANIMGAGTTYFPISSLLTPNVIQEAELVSVVAGDEDRAAVVFLGSTAAGGEQRGQGRENDCDAPSNAQVWNLYAAFTFDGGKFWRLEQLTNDLDPVQVGGIAERQYHPMTDPTDPTKMNAKCSNLRYGIDADIDSQGRLHILYADGCRPANGCPATANQSRDAWTTIARQQTGCGLLGRHDQPYPNACTIYMDGCAWYCRRIPIIPDRETFAGIDITTPIDGADFRPGEILVRGEVQRNPLDAMDAQIAGLGPFVVGQRFDLTTSIVGGTGDYVCHWGSDRQVAVLDNDFCDGTGIVANTTGVHRIHLDVFDCRVPGTSNCNPQRNIHREFQVNVLPAPVDCLDAPLVTDPQYDVWPYTHMVNDQTLSDDRAAEGSFRDIRALCVEDSGSTFTGFMDVRLGIQDLEPVTLAPGVRLDERDVAYAVRFCLNNHQPAVVCYGAQSYIDANGQRAVEGGVLAGAWADRLNPADHERGIDLCVLPGLVAYPAGNHVDRAADTVFFRFNKTLFDVTAPPGDCNAIVRQAGAGIQPGTQVSALTGGTQAPGDSAGVPGVYTADTGEGDHTHPRTGQQRNFTFPPPASGLPLEADAKGVYRTEVNIPVAIQGRVRGGTGPVLQCQWEKLGNFMQFAGPDNEWTCGATSVLFTQPGLYWVDFTARANLNSGTARVARPCNACMESDTDPTLFYVAKPEQPWDEQVVLLYDKPTAMSACPALPGAGNSRFAQVKTLVREDVYWNTYINVDTRTQGFARWETVLDLSGFDFGEDEVQGTRKITAVWLNGTLVGGNPDQRIIIDCDEIEIDLIEPRQGASPEGTPDPYRRPYEGIDDRIAEGFDEDQDGVYDGGDRCPGLPSADTDDDGVSDDLDGDGVGDECDPDLDGDGVLNGLDLDGPDNCPFTANPGQQDTDLDGVGDACEGDSDGDGIRDGSDNCVFAFNPDQADKDADEWGDLCDADIDGDGVANVKDAFPYDGSEWRDTDRDGIGDNADTDADGDRFSNAQELAAGTDPYDRRSFPSSSEAHDGPPQVASARLKGGWLFLFVALGVTLLVAVVLTLLWMPRRNA